jgi:hypothetical protein
MRRHLILLFVGLVISVLLDVSQLLSQEIVNPETEYLRVRTMAFEMQLSLPANW